MTLFSVVDYFSDIFTSSPLGGNILYFSGDSLQNASLFTFLPPFYSFTCIPSSAEGVQTSIANSDGGPWPDAPFLNTPLVSLVVIFNLNE